MALICGLWILGAAAAPASAAENVTFKVTNEAGRAQQRVCFRTMPAETTRGCTDVDGTEQIQVSPGEALYYSRNGFGSASVGAPEGYPGIEYRVPDPVPATTVELTVPTVIQDFPYQPTKQARYLAGAINQERAERGLEPLRISTTLSAAANASIGKEIKELALIDSGWPEFFASVGEAGTKNYPITDLMEAGPFSRKAFEPKNESIGVAHDRRGYVAFFGGECVEEPACGMTADVGVAPSYLKVGFGLGNVAVSPGGSLVDGSLFDGKCSRVSCPLLLYDRGTEVTLTANPDRDSFIHSWWYRGGEKICGRVETCTISLDALSTDIYVEMPYIHDNMRLGLRKAKRREKKVRLRYHVTRKAKGSFKVVARRGGQRHWDDPARRLRVKRHGRRMIATRKLPPGNWVVSARFRGRGDWPRVAKAPCVRVRAKGTPPSWERMRTSSPRSCIPGPG